MPSESQLRDEEVAKFYYEQGLKALEVYDFADALLYFSKAYVEAPNSVYGELAYLYYGKAYALYSYELGRKEGIFAALGYLNQYTFYYKFPRFWNTQKEFIGDSYFLLGWFEDARNVYAEVYGGDRKEKHLLKYAYASALLGDVSVVRLLRDLEEPKELSYLKHLSLGVIKASLGDYEQAILYLKRAFEENSLLSYDLHYNFYTGLSYKKLGDVRDAMFYLERAFKLDKFSFYRTKIYYHLFEVYLELKDFKGAKEIYEEVKTKLIFNPFYQVLFLNLWMYPDFLEKFKKEFKYYYEFVKELFWLKSGSPVSNYAILALLNKSLRERKLDKETEIIFKIRAFDGNEFVLDNELFNYNRQLKRLNRVFQNLNPYLEEEVKLVIKLFSLNERSFLNIFKEDKSREILVRAFVYGGDKRTLEFLNFVRDSFIRNFIKAKYLFAYGSYGLAKELLEKSLYELEGIDRLEANLLLFYVEKNPDIDEVVKLSKDYEEMKGYFPFIYRAVGDIYYSREEYRKAKVFYQSFLSEYKEKDIIYWATLIKLGFVADKLEDTELKEFVVARAKESTNLWSDVILSLWGE